MNPHTDQTNAGAEQRDAERLAQKTAYGVRNSQGYWTGIWNSRASAELARGKGIHGERVVTLAVIEEHEHNELPDMTVPIRIQLSRRKGWRMPPNTVKVDRTTRYGNDFVMAHEGMRATAIERFRVQAEAQMKELPAFYAPLRGKNLACWCPLDKPCHADVLLEIANR